MGLKKATLAVVFLCCLMMLAGCGTNIVGTWEVSAVSFDGQEMGYDEYIEFLNFESEEDTEITVKFSSDGKYNFSMMGEPLNGTWEEKDGKYALDFSGNAIEAELDGSELSMQLGMVIFKFKKN